MRRAHHPEAPGQPAASLAASLKQQQMLKRAGRPRWWRSSHRRVVCTAPLVAPAFLWFAFARGGQTAWVAAAFYAALLVGKATDLVKEESPDVATTVLRRRIRLERLVAAELQCLESSGWQVLHDRSPLGSNGRLAHIAIGPPGVVLVTPRAGTEDPSAEEESGQRAADVLRLALILDPSQCPFRVTSVLVGPATVRHLRHRLAAMPSVLPRRVEVLLTAVVDDLCPRLTWQPGTPLSPTHAGSGTQAM